MLHVNSSMRHENVTTYRVRTACSRIQLILNPRGVSSHTGVQRSRRPFDDVFLFFRQSPVLKQIGNEGLGRSTRRLKQVISFCCQNMAFDRTI